MPYQILNFLERSQLALIQSGEKKQVTLKNETVKTGDILRTSFGLAEVTSTIRLRGCCKVINMGEMQREYWAKREGFESFNRADLWFRTHFGEKWQEDEFTVLKFCGDWVQEA